MDAANRRESIPYKAGEVMQISLKLCKMCGNLELFAAIQRHMDISVLLQNNLLQEFEVILDFFSQDPHMFIWYSPLYLKAWFHHKISSIQLLIRLDGFLYEQSIDFNLF